MCGRFTLSLGSFPADLAALLGLATVPVLESAWNVAPTQTVVIVRAHPDTGAREAVRVRWGLVPGWAKDPSIGSRLINARGETVAEKPAFRAAFRRRRCLILTTGFYEWRPSPPPAQPFFIRLAHGRPFAMAGLWDRWTGPDGVALDTCAIGTIEANAAMRPVHHRMPVIPDPADWGAWLDPAVTDPARILPLVRACPAEWIVLHPVSTLVNNPRHDSPRLIEPVALTPPPDDLPFPPAGAGS